MKRLLSVLLAMCMLLTMAACGGGGTSASEAKSASEAQETTTPEISEQTEAPQQTVEAAPSAEEESTLEASAAEEPETLAPLSYPVSDGSTTLTYWYAYPPFVPNFLDDVSNKEIYQAINKAVGVNIKVVGYSLVNANEQFQLMVASGDYTDIIYSFGSNYSGSIEGAVEDEIITNLAPYLEEYAPDYTNYILTDEEVNLAVHTDAGYVPAFASIGNENVSVNGGQIIRTDFLDAVGKDMPTTYDELEDVLTAFKDELNIPSPYWSNPAGYVVEMTAGYGVYPGFYVEDGQVKYGFYEKGYFDYLTMMNRWYENGLLYADFAAQQNQLQFPDSSLVTNNQVGVWFNSLNEMTSYTPETATDPNFAITGMPILTKEKGETTHFCTAFSRVSVNSGNFISTNCKDLELAMAWCNYWYTDKGTLLANYGIEGESYEMVDGKPQFTDLVTNNPDMAFDIAISVYCEFNGGGYYVLNEKTDSNYTEVQLQARKNWLENSDGANVYPSYAALNAEESAVYGAKIGDVDTYVEEMTLKYITGAEPLTDESFQTYQATLDGFGMQDCIRVYQSAYDRYLAR